MRGSGPRRGRSPQASTTAAPRLPQPQSPRWLPRTRSLRHLLHWDAAVASAAGTPVAAASSSRPGARSQLQILRSAPGNCQFQLPQQPGSCSSQPPRANCRRRRRRLGSDCLRQPGTSRLSSAPLRSPAPLAAPPACAGPAPARTAGFLCCRLRPLSGPPPQRGQAAPVPGRVPLPGSRCSLCRETFLLAALGPLLSPGGGVEGGGGCVLASPSSREWLLPPTPSPLGPEPSFVFQAERTRWLLGPYPLVGGQLGRESYLLPLSLPL